MSSIPLRSSQIVLRSDHTEPEKAETRPGLDKERWLEQLALQRWADDGGPPDPREDQD